MLMLQPIWVTVMKITEGEITLTWMAMWSWRGAAGWERANLNTSIRACCLTSWSTGKLESHFWHLSLHYCCKQKRRMVELGEIFLNQQVSSTTGDCRYIFLLVCVYWESPYSLQTGCNCQAEMKEFLRNWQLAARLARHLSFATFIINF